MSKEQYKELCSESFALEALDFDGQPTHSALARTSTHRIQMPFISTPIFNQKRMIPLRWMPLVIELELQPDCITFLDTFVAGSDALKWELSDINALCDIVYLDPALDEMLQERHTASEIPLKMRALSLIHI